MGAQGIQGERGQSGSISLTGTSIYSQDDIAQSVHGTYVGGVAETACTDTGTGWGPFGADQHCRRTFAPGVTVRFVALTGFASAKVFYTSGQCESAPAYSPTTGGNNYVPITASSPAGLAFNPVSNQPTCVEFVSTSNVRDGMLTYALDS